MFKKSKKYLSFILSLCMIVSMFVGVIPTAYAEGQLSSEKAITAFDFAGLDPAVNGVIDEEAKTVTLTVPYGTDVKTLVPTIAVSTNATVSPSSEATQDFSSPVTYTVTAQDLTTQDYTVTVNITPASTEKVIISTTIGTLYGSSIINVPAGTKVDALKSALTVSYYATVEILDGSGGIAVVDQVNTDVTNTMVIEVTAQDGSKAEYAIAMQAVLSNDTTLTTSNPSVVTGISETTISVANAVYTKTLVDALVAPVGGKFELQNSDNSPATLDTDTTLVVDTMKVVVTAEDGSTTATYTIKIDEASDTAPIVLSAETGSDNTIVLTMDKSLTGTEGDPDAFTVIGIATDPTVTEVSISGTTVTIKVSDVIVASDTNIKISYNPSGTNDLTDGTSQVKAFDTVDVTNNIKYSVTFNVYNDSDQPIQNATVTLGDLTPETTDEFGSVTFTGVEDGTISYTVEATGYTTKNAQITVDGNNVTQTLTMVPESATTYTITFVVKDGENLVSGASVSLIDPVESNTIVTYTTDTNGEVIFDTIDAGEYNYSITKTGFAEKTGSISVVDTNLTEIVSIDYTPVETSVVITGSDTLESKLVGFIDYPAYTAVVNDQRDVEMVEKTVEWSIKDTDPTGVNINSSTGVVTVEDTATAGSFTIVATSTTDANVKAEKLITITKEVVVPVITITGADNTTVKLEGQGDSTESYTYVVKDQYGRVVEEQTVSWSLKTSVTGVSVDDNGLVTISDTTVDPSFILVATLDSDESVITEKTVTLTKEIQVVTSVEILDGGTPLVDAIEVETNLNTLGLLDHKNYNVVVKDQYGTVMDGKTATITLKNPVANLTVEPNGTNIFRFGGGGFTGNSSAILVATSDDDASVSYELTVNITFKSKFTVVSEFLNGSGDVTVSLTPSGMIYANCDITNNTDVDTEVLMIFALYKNDINGDELQGISAVSKVVNAHLSEKMKAGFLLPSDLTGYTVRVFVWDGNNIANANNVLSNLIQIP